MAERPVGNFASIDVVDGLTINPDGDWTFDPGNGSYDYLSAGDTQEIDVRDATNRFSIYVNGTNDAPVATAAQSATEDQSNGTFVPVAGTDDEYEVNLAGFFGADQSFALENVSLVVGDDAAIDVVPTQVTDAGDPTVVMGTTADGAGLSLALDGTMLFNAGSPAYTAMQDGETSVISASYEVTSAAGLTAINQFTIEVVAAEVSTPGANPGDPETLEIVRDASFRSTNILGQLTATDVDRGTVFRYESVGAPIDGLFIDETTGSWSFDSSHESYQDLKQGETLDITVN